MTVASGTIRVRSLATGEEWDEKVHVEERDLEERTPIEDTARRIARAQAGGQVETLEVRLG